MIVKAHNIELELLSRVSELPNGSKVEDAMIPGMKILFDEVAQNALFLSDAEDINVPVNKIHVARLILGFYLDGYINIKKQFQIELEQAIKELNSLMCFLKFVCPLKMTKFLLSDNNAIDCR